jgi:hypothetical protein
MATNFSEQVLQFTPRLKALRRTFAGIRRWRMIWFKKRYSALLFTRINLPLARTYQIRLGAFATKYRTLTTQFVVGRRRPMPCLLPSCPCVRPQHRRQSRVGVEWSNKRSDARMIRTIIGFVIGNYPLTFLVLGLIFSLFAIARAPRPITGDVVVEKLLAWYVMFNIGLMFLVNFVFHTFFGGLAARFIGWADSPFQLEVGTASLGFSVVGFIAAFARFDRRLVAIIGPSIFTLGAAAGHVYQMITAHNFAPGNAGAIFYTDILIPIVGFALLWLEYRRVDHSKINLGFRSSKVTP